MLKCQEHKKKKSKLDIMVADIDPHIIGITVSTRRLCKSYAHKMHILGMLSFLAFIWYTTHVYNNIIS